jgi:hypothetical protein
MALSIATARHAPISLAEFVDEMRGHDVSTEDGVAAAGELFAALNANKSVLVEHITGLLKQLRDDDQMNEYTGQTFMLHLDPRYFIRANAWLPAAYEPLKPHAESNQFFYGMPHDHNFTFMTAGHYGAGYRTTIYEYDGITKNYGVGERAATTFLEDTMLPEGKIMVFRASRDIHTQYAPDEFSISLNVMTLNPHELERTQRIFADDCETVRTHPRGNDAARNAFFALIPEIADDRTEAILHDLLASEKNEVSRCAREALDTIAASRATASLPA